MRCIYIVTKILLVVLVMALIIKFLLVFNPFSVDGKVDNAGFQEKPLDRTNNGSTLQGGSNTEEPDTSTGQREEEIIGQLDTKPDSIRGVEYNSESEGIHKKSGYFLTYEEISALEHISLRDKLTGMYIVRKVKGQDLEKILRIADGGITFDEWPKLNRILERSLKERDIDRLKQLIAKNKKLYEDGKLAAK